MFASKPLEADSLDNILASLGVVKVDHIDMTISGAEIEAIQGMAQILSKAHTRILLAATLLHESDDQPINKRVADILREKGFTAVCGRTPPKRFGSKVYKHI